MNEPEGSLFMGNTQARKYLTCVSSDSELDCFVGLPFLLVASFEGAAPVLWNPTGCHNYSQVVVSTYTSDLSLEKMASTTTWGHIWKRTLEKSQTCRTWAESEKKLREDTDCQNHHLIKPISCKTSQYCCANKFCPKNFSTLYLNLK